MKHPPWSPRVDEAIRIAAVASWLTLTILSLVPGEARPHTLPSGNAEHFIAYVLSAFLTRLGFRRVESRWQVAGFCLASGLFELCQIMIPGRHAGFDNWATSTAGALIGTVLARAIAHRLRFRPRRLQS